MALGVLLWILAILAIPREWKNIVMFILGVIILGTAYALGREGAPKKEFSAHKNTLTEGRLEDLQTQKQEPTPVEEEII